MTTAIQQHTVETTTGEPAQPSAAGAPVALPVLLDPAPAITVDEDDARMSRIEAGLAENTAATKRIEEAGGELLAFFEAGKAAFKVLHWIGMFARPIGYIAIALTSLLGIVAAIRGSGIGPK